MQRIFRVMIVDDEIYVVSLIQNLIDWERFQMAVVGTADNGFAALEAAQALQPDIIIVDVRMPGYDGITFMQKVREINKKVKFIVISGHKRFEYAKSAMQYHVEDYLLKPINKRELEELLQKLKEKLESEKQEEEVLVTMDSQLGASKKKVRDYLLEELLEGKNELLTASLDGINRTYLTELRQGGFLVVILKLDAVDMVLDASFSENMLAQITDICLERWQGLCWDILIKHKECEVLLLLNLKEMPPVGVGPVLRERLDKVRLALTKYDRLAVTVGVDRGFLALGDFPDQYREARKSIDSRIVLGIGQVIGPAMVKEDPGLLQVIFSDVNEANLMNAFKSFRADKIKLQVLEAFSRADEYRLKSTLIHQEVLFFIHRRFFEYLKQIDLYKGAYQSLREELEAGLVFANTVRQMENALIVHINSYIEEYIEMGKEKENPVIRIAKKYISENYQKNISLGSIAEVVNISPVYLSLLFKREVGINFLDYLNQYRIEASKKLLRDVRYQIGEVAGLVGFQDARHFSRMFKKTIGVTPKEYRSRNVS